MYKKYVGNWKIWTMLPATAISKSKQAELKTLSSTPDSYQVHQLQHLSHKWFWFGSDLWYVKMVLLLNHVGCMRRPWRETHSLGGRWCFPSLCCHKCIHVLTLFVLTYTCTYLTCAYLTCTYLTFTSFFVHQHILRLASIQSLHNLKNYFNIFSRKSVHFGSPVENGHENCHQIHTFCEGGGHKIGMKMS